MHNRSLIICDMDKEYSIRLADYFTRSECGYEVLVYTEPVIFAEDFINRQIDILLIREDFFTEVQKYLEEYYGDIQIEVARKYILTDDRNCESEGGIYKYQSGGAIVAAIGEDIEARHRIVNEAVHYNGMKLLGVYSPVNHTLKTTFAITLGQILSERGRVLYVNLEGYNGLSQMLDIRSEYNLQDLLYEYSLKPGSLNDVLMKYIVKAEELEVLIPVRSPYELQEIDTDLWISFLSDLLMLGKYEVIILDISDSVRGVPELLNICTGIYMPLRKDAFSMAKLKDFDEVLMRYPGSEGIRDKLVRLKFPFFEDIDGTFNKLKTSRLGRYIRNELCII